MLDAEVRAQKEICPWHALTPGLPITHPRRMSFFVTGTDTGVGKTYVTRLLLEALRREGIDAAGYKPVACGDRDDAVVLAAASGGLPLDEVNPVHLQTPVAPHVACMLENRSIDLETLHAGYQHLVSRHACVLVEGAGGWEVPLSGKLRISDFVKELGLPVIVVAVNRLGALNHILLTIDAIRAKGLVCAGIILNQLDDELDTAMITNKGIIEELSGVPLLDHLIKDQDFIDDRVLQILGITAAGN